MESEVANIILGKAGPSDRFRIRWCGMSFYLSIKPLTARQIIRISALISKIKMLDPEEDMFPALLEGSQSLRYISWAIAISTGTKMPQIVSRAILKLPLEDIQTLFMIVRKQANAERFFFIMALAKGLNKLKAAKGPQ